MEGTSRNMEARRDPCVTISVVVHPNGGNGVENGAILTPLVFNIEDIKTLRKLGICGILSGTLPTASQQNIFLSVPLKLMVEETIWLVLNGYAKMKILQGPTSQIIQSIIDENGEAIRSECNTKLQKSFDLQRQYKREQHLLKLQKLGIEQQRSQEKNNGNNKLIESSLFVETPTDSSLFDYFNGLDTNKLVERNIINLLIDNYGKWNDYLLFQSLRNQKYIMSPGARFGGLFIAYPGDPLRYHSHLTIKSSLDYYNEPIDFISLASGARLGTNVKKLLVIGGVKDSIKDTAEPDDDTHIQHNRNEVSFFSIEWAGFG